MDIDFQNILFYIGPNSNPIIWTIFLYTLFFLALVMLFAMPDKNMIPTLLVATVLMAVVVAKLSLAAESSNDRPIFDTRSFGMYVVNIIPFVFPLITAGMVRARSGKAKGRVVPPAILTGLIGGVYFFSFWYFFQQN